MTLSLQVDTARWREQLEAVAAAAPGLVPVIKGNGYGFGKHRLAEEAKLLGVDAVAVGEPEEVPDVAAAFGGEVLVLAPWRPEFHDVDASADGHIVHTVAHLDALRLLAGCARRPRVVLEVMTSMRRHGIPPADLPMVAPLLDGVRFEGVALHLPLDRRRTGHIEEVEEQLGLLAAAGISTAVVWVSHLAEDELELLQRRHPGVLFRPRVGTGLWLRDRCAVEARATVLDVHRLSRGTTYGYRRRRMPTDGTLVVVSGGTSHGIGMEAPKYARGALERAKVAARGALGAVGRSLSPFWIGGERRWFAEPPHMQVSLVLLPEGVPPPALGEEVKVDVRMTTTAFDRVTDVALAPSRA